jgi:two-component system chemotaxis response regulator CheY
MGREIRTILIIDDSASILFYLGMLLRRLEYNVVTARNAEDAMQIMEQSVPAIVLSEIFLPSMSGINLMKRMKDAPLWKVIPVIVLTTESDPGMKDTCMRLGCAAYLSKPVEPDVLYRTLQSVSETIPRENIRLQVSLKVIVGDGTVMGGTARTEYATAVSESGLYVRTLYPQPRNALTPIRIIIGNREISAKTVVLYSFITGGSPFKEPGMGLKFIEIADSDKNFIRGFIKEQLTRGLSPENNGILPVS